MTRQVKLSQPYHGAPQSEVDQYEANMRAIRALQDAELPVYLEFIAGDRKGSIARWINKDGPLEFHNRYRRELSVRNQNGQCVWDDRKNKINWFLQARDTVWLPDYLGPTVWEKFDAKAAKAKLLDNIKEEDIDGKRLFVGDKVLYINARYGGGAQLCHGTIDRFEAKADSRSHTVFTIVKEDGKDMESKIQYPGAFIWKK